MCLVNHGFVQASEMLRKLHMRLLVRRYVRGVTAQQKAQVSCGDPNLIFPNFFREVIAWSPDR